MHKKSTAFVPLNSVAFIGMAVTSFVDLNSIYHANIFLSFCRLASACTNYYDIFFRSSSFPFSNENAPLSFHPPIHTHTHFIHPVRLLSFSFWCVCHRTIIIVVVEPIFVYMLCDKFFLIIINYIAVDSMPVIIICHFEWPTFFFMSPSALFQQQTNTHTHKNNSDNNKNWKGKKAAASNCQKANG